MNPLGTPVRRLALALTALLVAACGGSSSTPPTTIDGVLFTAVSVAVGSGTTSAGAPTNLCSSSGCPMLELAIANNGRAACASDGTLSDPYGWKSSLAVVVDIYWPSGGAIAAGTYAINSLGGPLVVASVANNNATCVNAGDTNPILGTVTIAGVSATSISGAYNLAVGGSDVTDILTGTFDAAPCSLSADEAGGETSPPACQ